MKGLDPKGFNFTGSMPATEMSPNGQTAAREDNQKSLSQKPSYKISSLFQLAGIVQQ